MGQALTGRLDQSLFFSLCLAFNHMGKLNGNRKEREKEREREREKVPSQEKNAETQKAPILSPFPYASMFFFLSFFLSPFSSGVAQELPLLKKERKKEECGTRMLLYG